MTTPENPISEYQKWKQQGESLRTKARQAMETRFHELLSEAAQIAQEYRVDFGKPLKPRTPVTAFRFTTAARGKSKNSGKPAKPAKGADAARAPASDPRPEVIALQKKLALAQKKLDAAKASGKATKNLEDKVYEIEDELRLAVSHA